MKSLETNLKQADTVKAKMEILKDHLEKEINLAQYTPNYKHISVKADIKMMRICLLAGLSEQEVRTNDFQNIVLTSNSVFPTLFTTFSLTEVFSSLIKLRYHHLNVNWEDNSTKSRVINAEILRGFDLLMKENNLSEWLKTSTNTSVNAGKIPFLNLEIGKYAGEIPAYLDMNSKNITNTQILIAGTTGSGKSNLLAVLMHQMRSISIETDYPVNFLFFDYKGEFSDVANNEWLNDFGIDRSAILNPVEKPLPFTPFKDFTGKTQNEINLYSTELAETLCNIDKATISANMSNRLSTAIINAYNLTNNKPITFAKIIESYTMLQAENKKEEMDSIKSVLDQLQRANLFAEEDTTDLITSSYIIKMDKFPKGGVVAKAVVYFIISKLNTIYENLPKQASDKEKVALRHFTIIDEAHYMLDFPNPPLKELIAVGRNKGMSIILATQNMESYKSKHFDFYANAQYPLIMKQQSINDSVIKDVFGVTGSDLAEIKQAISGLQKGELIIRNNGGIALGMGKRFKKMMVNHQI